MDLQPITEILRQVPASGLIESERANGGKDGRDAEYKSGKGSPDGAKPWNVEDAEGEDAGNGSKDGGGLGSQVGRVEFGRNGVSHDKAHS